MATPFSSWLEGPLGAPAVALGAEIGYSSKDTVPHWGEDRQSRGSLCRLPVFAVRHPPAVRRQQCMGGASAQGDPVKPQHPRFLLGAGHMGTLCLTPATGPTPRRKAGVVFTIYHGLHGHSDLPFPPNLAGAKFPGTGLRALRYPCAAQTIAI